MAPQKTKKGLTFITNDIAFASTLMFLGKRLIKTAPREDRPYEKEFHFEDDGTCDDLMVEFINGDTRVDPVQFMQNIRSLKTSR